MSGPGVFVESTRNLNFMVSPSEPKQSVIPLSVGKQNVFDSFQSEDNQHLVEQLKSLIRGDRDSSILSFYGPKSCGKTHLLEACCNYAESLGRTAHYINGGVLQENELIMPAAGENQVFCLDDLQLLLGHTDLQLTLLTLYEAVAGSDSGLIVAADKPLSKIGLELNDLTSRLSIGGTYGLQPLGENARIEALKKSALNRGFELPDSVVNFIMTHCDRDPAALFALLDKIDNLSLAQKRRITVPFVKSLL